ncbi:MAG: ABC transporter ATP-binding protein [Candidatus Kapaibacterium sp.]|jgi:ATP-binding cassette subfamily B multidrug efflux pump
MKSLLRLLPYFARHKKKFFAGFLLVLGSTVAQVVMPVFVGRVVDSLKTGTSTPGSLATNALLIIGSSIASGFLFFLVRQTIIVASRLMEFDLRNDFLSHLERLSMRFFQNTPQGEVMAYATNDINAVRNFIGPAIMYSADTVATVLFALGFMLAISPWLTLVIVLPLPLMSLGVYMVGKRVHPLFDAVQEQYSDLTARATESISGIRVVRAYVREEYEKKVMDRLSKGYFTKNMKLIKVQGLMMPIIVFFMGFSGILLLLIGGPMVINKTITLGDFVKFMMYLNMLTWPFIALGWVTNMIQRSAASMLRLAKIFDTTPEVQNSEHTDWHLKEIHGEIVFQNVTMRYREELEPAVKNINLHIPQGKTLAIIGRTGSGKSTLVSLIARLYDPTEGSILVDGHDSRAIPIEALRGAIGFVTQETFLFSDTIANNIGFGKPEATFTEIENAAKAADLYDNILDFPAGFETMLGERGITLSGGQKQRTAIARAIARDPKILILDDTMSAVDTATEERILRNLRRLMHNRTSILISHRISTVKEADTIIVLDHGEIVESGTHESLLDLRGHYHDLYRKQLLEEALENA